MALKRTPTEWSLKQLELADKWHPVDREVWQPYQAEKPCEVNIRQEKHGKGFKLLIDAKFKYWQLNSQVPEQSLKRPELLI